MHPKNRFMVWTLFVLAITTIVQCSDFEKPSKQNLSIIDKLDEISKSNKCTYLQNQLLEREEFAFFKREKFNDVLNATVTLTNAEKVHCMIFLNIYEHLCMQHSTTEKMITLDTIKRAKEEDVKSVCEKLVGFYKLFNASSLGTIMQNKNVCDRICTDFNGNVFPACSVSALMANVIIQMVQQHLPQPEHGSKDLNAPMEPVVLKVAKGGSVPVAVPAMNNDSNASKVQSGISKSGDKQTEEKKVSSPTKEKSQLEPEVDVHAQGQPSSQIAHAPEEISHNSKGINNGDSQSASAISQQAAETPEKPITLDNNSIRPETKAIGSIEENPENKAESALIQPNSQMTPIDSEHKPGNVVTPKQRVSTVATTSKPVIEKDYNNDDLDEDAAPPDVGEENASAVHKMPAEKPLSTNDDDDFTHSVTSDDIPTNDSYFFSYFMFFCILFVMGYVGYHNKQKILALLLEGRRGRRQQRRRPNTANYHKLDSNLEEAVTSSCDKTTSNVIY